MDNNKLDIGNARPMYPTPSPSVHYEFKYKLRQKKLIGNQSSNESMIKPN